MELRTGIDSIKQLFTPPPMGKGGNVGLHTRNLRDRCQSHRATGAWDCPTADPDVDSSRVAPSAPNGAQQAFKGRCTPQKHPIEP